eukprot:TRINITY_DN64610_c0_g1_i1.p1 TRINITY_DN64610_c0_g1~~TRINITY_DN64610_c0_g1_i1.p1  ORF type:complete len:458 (-),score=33.99 TRINITY_DN64610_c0_g1_i1:89-1303(-)
MLKERPGMHCMQRCGYDLCGACAQTCFEKVAGTAALRPDVAHADDAPMESPTAMPTRSARETVKLERVESIGPKVEQTDLWCLEQLRRLETTLTSGEARPMPGLEAREVRREAEAAIMAARAARQESQQQPSAAQGILTSCSPACSSSPSKPLVAWHERATSPRCGRPALSAEDGCGVLIPPVRWRSRLLASKRETGSDVPPATSRHPAASSTVELLASMSSSSAPSKRRSMNNTTMLRMIERRASANFYADPTSDAESPDDGDSSPFGGRQRASANAVRRLLREPLGTPRSETASRCSASATARSKPEAQAAPSATPEVQRPASASGTSASVVADPRARASPPARPLSRGCGLQPRAPLSARASSHGKRPVAGLRDAGPLSARAPAQARPVQSGRASSGRRAR